MNTQITDYTFDASARTVTFTSSTPLLEQISLITNVRTGEVIYQFNNPIKLAVLSGNVLTLEYDTSGMLSGDKLKINSDFNVIQPVSAQIPAIAITKKSVVTTNSGDFIIHTPQSGKKIRLFSFGYSASGIVDTGNIKVRWKFGLGDYLDTQFLTGNQAYGKSPGNGKFCYEGNIDEALIINLDLAATIAMNIDYEEI